MLVSSLQTALDIFSCKQIATKFGGGVDKLPLQQRYQWAADHHTQIFEAAENPVHGSRWWMEVRRRTCLAIALRCPQTVSARLPFD